MVRREILRQAAVWHLKHSRSDGPVLIGELVRSFYKRTRKGAAVAMNGVRERTMWIIFLAILTLLILWLLMQFWHTWHSAACGRCRHGGPSLRLR